MTFRQQVVDGRIRVIPRDAEQLLATGKLDPRLFNVRYLLQHGYGDKGRERLPLIVQHGKGMHARGRRPRGEFAAPARSPRSTRSR